MIRASTAARSPSDWRILRHVVVEALSERWLLATTAVLGLLATPIALLQPVPLKIIVDSVLGSAPLPGMLGRWFPDGAHGKGLLLAAVVAQVVVVVLAQAQAMGLHLLQVFVGERITLRFRGRLLAHVQRLSFAFHDRVGTHDSIYRIQYDAPAIQQIVVHTLITSVSSAIMLIAMAVVMLEIHVQLALVGMAIIPLLFLVSRAYSLHMRPHYKKAHELESRALGVVHEVLSAFRVVKAFGREAEEEQRFRRQSGRSVAARLRLGFAEAGLALLVSVCIGTGTAVVLYIGAGAVLQDRLRLGELLLVVGYLAQLYGPVRAIGKNVATVQKQLASAERAFELIHRVPDVVERPGAVPLARAAGSVEFDDVHFSYDTRHDVLRGVSLRVEPGTRVGIVGRTGSGKTTLVSLLTRFYDARSGRILLDGRDVADYRLADLRRQFAIVLQEPVLFSTSIGENIAYARPTAAQEEIEAAARAAGAHDFILRTPEGYDTVVGERGMRLSGGERQRISLARAFLKDAPLLILDEPTSSVDVATEASIMSAMSELMEGRTTFMIAHRLSTIRDCDVVLELADGTVREVQRASSHLDP